MVTRQQDAFDRVLASFAFTAQGVGDSQVVCSPCEGVVMVCHFAVPGTGTKSRMS